MKSLIIYLSVGVTQDVVQRIIKSKKIKRMSDEAIKHSNNTSYNDIM